MSVEIILNRESQIILAEGHGHRWNFWNLSALGILLGLACFFLAAWYAFSRPIQIPADTAMLAVYSPKSAAALLTQEWLNKLPGVCREFIPSDSDWPIVCGMTSDGEAFAITPRWWNLGDRTNSGLVSRSRIPERLKTVDFRYSTALGWRGLAKQPVIQINSSAIERWLGLEANVTGTGILFQWTGTGFKSDLRLGSQTSPLPAGDIAFYLDAETWGSLPGDLFLDAANLPDRNQWKPLPSIERYALWLGENRSQTGKFIGFRESLDQSQAARVLGMNGVTERRQITLPDGSTSFERLLPTAATGTDLFGRRQNDQGQMIDLTPRSLLVSNTSTMMDQTNIAPCGTSYPWIRLSGLALNNLFGIDLRGVQGYSENGMLNLCIEK